MPCERVKIGDGYAIVCSDGKRQVCVGCKRWADRLCDWKLGDNTTCDAPLCWSCTSVPAPDKDLCPKHAAVWARRLRQFGG